MVAVDRSPVFVVVEVGHIVAVYLVADYMEERLLREKLPPVPPSPPNAELANMEGNTDALALPDEP